MSDNAKSFTANIIKEICNKLNIDNKHTLPFNACPNSSERVHKNLGEILRALVGDNQNQWDKYTSAITLAFNSAKSRATSYSPHFLMFGRSPRIELDILDSNQNPTLSEDEYVNQTMGRLNKAFDFVQH